MIALDFRLEGRVFLLHANPTLYALSAGAGTFSRLHKNLILIHINVIDYNV